MQINVCSCQSLVDTITFQCQKSVSNDAYIVHVLQADNHNYLSGITKAGIKGTIMAAKSTQFRCLL